MAANKIKILAQLIAMAYNWRLTLDTREFKDFKLNQNIT